MLLYAETLDFLSTLIAYFYLFAGRKFYAAAFSSNSSTQSIHDPCPLYNNFRQVDSR